jgi:hypothetical protein
MRTFACTTCTAVLLLAVGAHAATLPVGKSILLDNRCDADEWRDAESLPLGEGVTWLRKQDARYVYLCLVLPAGSYGTIDVYLQPADGSAPWNLHASAQLGERQRTEEGWPEAWTWGNQRDWYSPAVPFSGVEQGEKGARATFAALPGREIQIARARFGAGPWRLMFELRALGAARDRSLVHPVGATPDDPSEWDSLPL